MIRKINADLLCVFVFVNVGLGLRCVDGCCWRCCEVNGVVACCVVGVAACLGIVIFEMKRILWNGKCVLMLKILWCVKWGFVEKVEVD